MAKRGRKRRTVLFVLELVILLVLLGGLYVYGQISSSLDGIKTKKLDMNKVDMNNLVAPENLTGYTNIALFGVDSRDTGESAYESANSDTIIIASINNDTKEVRLCSIYRDTLLVVNQDQNGEDNYQKCNAAFAYGGVEGTISMMNTNLDLNIADYVAVDFNALATVIDLLGGLDIEMSGAEVEHMNNYCVETSKVTGKSYTPIPRPDDDEYRDTYHLNGVQATSYARIRYTAGLDFERTERQRLVIQKIVEKAKKASLATLTDIMEEVFPMISTSFSKEEVFTMGAGMLTYKFGETTGFPFKHYESTMEVKGSVVIPTTLAVNVKQLHFFLFDDSAYQPSETVKQRSDVIVAITGYGYNEVTQEVTVENSNSPEYGRY